MALTSANFLVANNNMVVAQTVSPGDDTLVSDYGMQHTALKFTNNAGGAGQVLYIYNGSPNTRLDGFVQADMTSTYNTSNVTLTCIFGRLQGTTLNDTGYFLIYTRNINNLPSDHWFVGIAKGDIVTLNATGNNFDSLLALKSLSTSALSTSTGVRSRTLKLEIVDDSGVAILRGYVNGSLSIQAIDYSPLGTGRWGFGAAVYTGNARTLLIDNFSLLLP